MGSCCEKKRDQLSRYNKLMIRLKELIIRENELMTYLSRYGGAMFIFYISIVWHGISIWSVISVLCYTKKMIWYTIVWYDNMQCYDI